MPISSTRSATPRTLSNSYRRPRLIQAASIFELRFRPDRLVHEMAIFLDDVWK